MTELQLCRESLLRQEQRNRVLARRLMLNEQATMKRLSLTIHDGMTQIATAAHTHWQAFAVEFFKEGPLTPERYDALKAFIPENLRLTKETVVTSRTLANNIAAPVLENFGIEAAIRKDVQYHQSNGWNIYLLVDSDGPPKFRPERFPEAEEALYRVFTQSISNIDKHARATRTDVRLSLLLDEEADDYEPLAVLTITDNGAGFDPRALSSVDTGPGERIGLYSIQTQVEALGGQFEIRSAPERGTTIRASVPTATIREERSEAFASTES